MNRALMAGMLAALAGCGSGGDTDVGGVTPSEARALNDAAAMLDDAATPAIANTKAP